MTFDDAMLMAYSDGELGPADRTRIEQAMALDPYLAERVSTFAAFGHRVRDAFAPVSQAPVPAKLSAMVAGNVVSIASARVRWRWPAGLAVAASLILGVGLGVRWNGTTQSPTVGRNGTQVASGPLAHALDTQLASASGDVRMLVSFRSKGEYCRVFASTAIDGIACHDGNGWQLRQTRPGTTVSGRDYRQARSADATLLALAQNMMDGAPLDAVSERRARARGWQ